MHGYHGANYKFVRVSLFVVTIGWSISARRKIKNKKYKILEFMISTMAGEIEETTSKKHSIVEVEPGDIY